LVDGISIKNKEEDKEGGFFSGFFDQFSSTEKKILESINKNDVYRLKVSNNVTPTVSVVAKLPDIYSQGFILIYNQLQELIGDKKKGDEGKGGGGSASTGLGKVFQGLGIGLEALGKGFTVFASGLKAMGSPAIFIGILAVDLVLVSILAFVAGLGILEEKGMGLGSVLRTLTTALVDLVSGLAGVLSDNQEFIEMFLDKLLEGFRIIPSILGELSKVIEALMPGVIVLIKEVAGAFKTFLTEIVGVIDAVGKFITDVLDSLFDNVTTTIERLSKVDGAAMIVTGAGIAAIGVGMAVLVGSTVIDGVVSFFTKNAMLDKLEAFAELGPRLGMAGTGLKDLASGLFSLTKLETKGFLKVGNIDVDGIVDFVKQFDNKEFKQALYSLKFVLPDFEKFGTTLALLGDGLVSIAEMDDGKYNKAIKRVRELVGLSKEAGANIGVIANGLSSEKGFKNPMYGPVQDAMFTLESSTNSGSFFQTDKGLIKTDPMDNLSIVASTNKPAGGDATSEMVEALTGKFETLFQKLDEYTDAILNKEPDVAVIQGAGRQQGALDELLKVGV